MKKKSEESISSLLIDGQIRTSTKEISNHFNNFFTSFAKEINKNIVKPKQTHLSYLGRENNNTIFLSRRTQFSYSIGGHGRPNKFNENKQSKWSK